MGVMDKYLSASHAIPGGGTLSISRPVITVSVGRMSPVLGCLVGAHIFTWQGTLYLCFSFPEAHMGTLQDQIEAFKLGLKTASVLEWIDRFMIILTGH